uniref:Uncharacterized protein n=1 Tax=Rhizophora mucronata TaxID=61149 RepID=A0A2P2N3S8_RHIMU
MKGKKHTEEKVSEQAKVWKLQNFSATFDQ